MHHYKDDVPHAALVGRLPGVDEYCARISVVRAARRPIAEVGLWKVTACGLEHYERLSTEALRRHIRIHLTCELRDGSARGLHPLEWANALAIIGFMLLDGLVAHPSALAVGVVRAVPDGLAKPLL